MGPFLRVQNLHYVRQGTAAVKGIPSKEVEANTRPLVFTFLFPLPHGEENTHLLPTQALTHQLPP